MKCQWMVGEESVDGEGSQWMVEIGEESVGSWRGVSG